MTKRNMDKKQFVANGYLSYQLKDADNSLFQRFIKDLDNRARINVPWKYSDGIIYPEYMLWEVGGHIQSSDYFFCFLSNNRQESLKETYGNNNSRCFELETANSNNSIYPPPIVYFIKIDDVPLPQYSMEASIVDLTQNYESEFTIFLSTLNHTRGSELIKFELDKRIDGKTVIDVSGEINLKLLKYFSKHPDELRVIDRRKFEELIAELFSGFGYEVELTKKTRDGGRDIIAFRKAEIESCCLIECKRPDPGRCVGISPVRELYGVKTDQKATKAILATTAYFSKTALSFFEKHKWELEPKDFNGIMEWINHYIKLK